jgi:hypothetical protein
MDTELETESNSQPSQASPKKRYVPAKHARKKKVTVFILVAGASAFGTLAWLNKSADPTTWESMRTDYNNTK